MSIFSCIFNFLYFFFNVIIFVTNLIITFRNPDLTWLVSVFFRMAKQIDCDGTRKHNQPITLVPPEPNFEDVMDWLSRSKISYDVQAGPEIYCMHVEEFWRTAKVKIVDRVKMIIATVRNKEMNVTEEKVRDVLCLEDNPKDPMRLLKEDILEEFKGMNYVGDFRGKNEIKRNGLTKDWKFILRTFALRLVHRKGGYDGLNFERFAVMLNLCTDQPFNIFGMIFYCMVDNANKVTWAMYARFVQLLINDQHRKLLHDGKQYKFQMPTGRQITELKTNECVMMHHWIYRQERLSLVLAAYKKYRDGVREARENQANEEEEEEEAEEEPQLVCKRKDKGKKIVKEGESKKSKKGMPNSKQIMGDNIRVGSNREEIERMQALHAVREAETRERRMKRWDMTESETPVVVTAEEE
ncbi:hypothetical protein Hanom_Chr10g00872211 [Helianthus anomalus]